MSESATLPLRFRLCGSEGVKGGGGRRGWKEGVEGGGNLFTRYLKAGEGEGGVMRVLDMGEARKRVIKDGRRRTGVNFAGRKNRPKKKDYRRNFNREKVKIRKRTIKGKKKTANLKRNNCVLTGNVEIT